jgi:uncharacterized membrane protein YsdA (DUF1294 family)
MVVLALAWLIAVNLVTWRAFAHDKAQAIQGGWRVPENTLLLMALLGGWPAAKLAQRRLRHKTRKQPFGSLLHLSIAGNLALAAGLAALDMQAVPSLLRPVAEAAATDHRPSGGMPRRFGPGS